MTTTILQELADKGANSLRAATAQNEKPRAAGKTCERLLGSCPNDTAPQPHCGSLNNNLTETSIRITR